MDRLNQLNISLGKWFGIPVSLHWSFVLFSLFFLVVKPTFFIFMSAVFFCVLLHELGHALAAKKFNILTRSIVLYPIGGLASLNGDFKNAKAEFVIAIAGPMVNIVLAPIFFILGVLSGPSVGSFLITLSLINLVLAVFNLVPAFPMDGGRLLRATLNWYWSDFLKATKVAVGVGKCFCVLMGVAGFLIPSFMMVLIAPVMWFGGEGELKMAKLSVGEGTPEEQRLYNDFQRLVREVDEIRR